MSSRNDEPWLSTIKNDPRSEDQMRTDYEGRIAALKEPHPDHRGHKMSAHTPCPSLLPCPFCGHSTIFLNEPSQHYRHGSINCPACLATMPGEVRDRKELIGCWNERARDHHFDALVKALEAVTDARMPGEARRIARTALAAVGRENAHAK